MVDTSISIGQAAKYLDISVDTLREWDEKGKLAPIRTEGGHRRYLLADLNKIKKVDTNISKSYICSQSVKVGKLKEAMQKILDGFTNDNDLVIFTTMQHDLYNRMTLMLEKEDKINCFSVEG